MARKRKSKTALKTKTKRKEKTTTKTTTKLKGYYVFKDAAGWSKILGKFKTSPVLRRLLLKKYPHGFLLIRIKGRRVEPKYPIINPKTGKIEKKGVIAAIYRAYQHGHTEVLKRALEILKKKYGAGIKIGNKVWTVINGKIVKLSPKGLKHLKA